MQLHLVSSKEKVTEKPFAKLVKIAVTYKKRKELYYGELISYLNCGALILLEKCPGRELNCYLCYYTIYRTRINNW